MPHRRMTVYAKFEGPFNIVDPSVLSRLKAFLERNRIFFATIRKSHSNLHCLFQFWSESARQHCASRDIQECFLGASLKLLASPIRSFSQISDCWNSEELLFEKGQFRPTFSGQASHYTMDASPVEQLGPQGPTLMHVRDVCQQHYVGGCPSSPGISAPLGTFQMSSLHISAANSALVPALRQAQNSASDLLQGHDHAQQLGADTEPVANFLRVADRTGSETLGQCPPHISRNGATASALVMAARNNPPSVVSASASRAPGSYPCYLANASAKMAMLSATASGHNLERSKAQLPQTTRPPVPGLQSEQISMHRKEFVLNDGSGEANSSSICKSAVAVRITERTGCPSADAETMTTSLTDLDINSLASLSLLNQEELIQILPKLSRFEAENILLSDDSWKDAWFQQMIIKEGSAEQQSMANTGRLCSRALAEANILDKKHLLRLSDKDMETMKFPLALRILVRQKRVFVSPETHANDHGQLDGGESEQANDVQTYDENHSLCKSTGSDFENPDAQDREVAQALMDLKDSANKILSIAEAAASTSLDPWHELYKTASSFFRESVSNPEGSGSTSSLPPMHQIRVLRAGLEALKKEHGYTQGKPLGLIDLGCGSGHVLVCGALSGMFSAFRGINYKQTEVSLHGQFQQFLERIRCVPSLASELEKIKKVEFFWANITTDITISQLLDNRIESMQMVYWSAAGWNARDIAKAANMLSRSEAVGAVVYVGLLKAVGAHSQTVLEQMNSTEGAQFFFLNEQVGSLLTTGGNSCHTAYILIRTQQDKLKYPAWPYPQTQQSVEVLFEDGKWHAGRVYAFDPRVSRGNILFDDGDLCEFNLGDPDISFLPRADLQWQLGSNLLGPGFSRALAPLYSNCTLCSLALCCNERIECTRCVHVFHARCTGFGLSTIETGFENFLCNFCRSDLAESGRRQTPSFVWDPTHVFCAGCGYDIQGSKLNPNVFDYCTICNAPFGYCCSARTSSAGQFKFRCCGCIGRQAHDSYLGVIFRVISEKISARCDHKKKTFTSQDMLLQDQFANAVTSLQQQCLYNHLRDNLPALVMLTGVQLQRGCDPSLGLFDALKLIETDGGFTWQTYQKLSSRHAEILHKRAGLSGPIPYKALQTQETSCGAKKKLAFVTADLRITPWWSLMKVFLLWIAQHYDMFMISVPEVEHILDDPHYMALCKLAQIIEFPVETSHKIIADQIKSLRVDVLIDGGGPTSGSLTGVLVYRPALLQLAFLGFPCTQNGQHIDGTIADQCVLAGRQLLSATERIIFLPICYQPHSAYSLPANVHLQLPTVPTPSRKEMGLPDEKFVFCFFGELGRLSPNLIRTYANILRRCPDSVLWLRQFPRLAYPRVVAQFVIYYADAEERIIPAPDVPNEEHMARLPCASLSLDSDLYSQHTGASDCLKNGVLFLAVNLKDNGDFFHRRVSSSLVKAAMGSDELIASSLDEVEQIAVSIASNPTVYDRHCRTLRASIKEHIGLFDVEGYVSGFVRGVDEMWRQKNAGLPLQDVFTSQPMMTPRDQGVWTVVLPGLCSREAGTSPLRAAKRKLQDTGFLAEADITRNVLGQGRILSNSACCCLASEAGGNSCTQDHDPELQAIIALAKTDSDGARLLAKTYIEKNIPEGRKIHVIKLDNGQQLLAIQLPFESPIIRFSTGAQVGVDHLPLLYLAEGKHGLHLYMGQHTFKDTFLTAYDGMVVDSNKVEDFRWAISLGYKTLCVDGSKVRIEVQVIKGSLGCFSNHKEHNSLASFVHRDVISPVSGHSKSIHLKAKQSAVQHDEITSFYTPGSARRHDIPREDVIAGCNNITDAQLTEAGLSKLVVSGMQVLQEQGGYDLLAVLGKGGFGGVLKVRHCGNVFAVKLGSSPYDTSLRHDVLVEAAVMGLAARGSNQFSLRLHVSAGWSSGAALLKSGANRIAAVAMQCADSSAHTLWCTMSTRFQTGDVQLLPDFRSVLKATTQVIAWAHQQELVHGDLHAGNVFLIRLAGHGAVGSGIATCCVLGKWYQVLLGDWGLARWSSLSDVAHCFTESVKAHPPIRGLLREVAPVIFPVSVQDLNVSYGLQRKTPADFPHPGGGSYMIRAPNWKRRFEGEDDINRKQRDFDQSGDAWALGVMAARVIAPRPKKEQGKDQEGHKVWAQQLRTASENAFKIEAHGHAASSRAKRAFESIQAEQGNVIPWIIGFCRKLNSGNTWDPLFHRLNGAEAEQWNLLLDLLQSQLNYSSRNRMKPMRALEHAFFSYTPAE